MNPSPSSHRALPGHLAVKALPAAVLSALCTLSGAAAQAQTANTLAAQSAVSTLTVTAPAERQSPVSVGGLPDAPGWATPQQSQRFGQDTLRDAQVQRLADLVKLDASASDAYNSVGYWDYLSVRGFTLDNAHNYRREGLPINAETRLALDNKSAVELFKGTSGMQAGVSAPGGLVNLLVKRPDARVRELTLGLNDSGGWLTSVDLSDRFGEQQQYGLRLNMAKENLSPKVRHADGDRRLVAVAGDWALAPGSKLEAEFEHSFHSQISVPGFSLLGTTLPSAKSIDPNINLNAQPWSRPVDLKGNTGTVGWKQRWADGWNSKITYGEQHLQSTDRAAFPFGCSAEENYTAYCSDGTFDLYDFRSQGESRVTRALHAELSGAAQTGAVQHQLTVGVLRSQHTTRLNTSAYNFVSSQGNVSGRFGPVDPDPTPGYVGTNRRENSTELSLVDALSHDGPWRAWMGVRHTQLDRRTELTDRSQSNRLKQDVNTAWGAVGYQFSQQVQPYVSWGQGFEAYGVPTNASGPYDNASDVLPVRRSRQLEVGVKGQQGHGVWSVNAFNIHRPVAGVVGNAFLPDGEAVHQGLEASWQTQWKDWTLFASTLFLNTERRGSQQAAVNGQQAVNVPEQTLKVSATWRVPTGLTWGLPLWVQGDVVHEGQRAIDDLNTQKLPSWTRTDLSLRALQNLQGRTITWRVGVTNLFDLRAWRESPTYSGHVYLFPLAARTVNASATIDF